MAPYLLVLLAVLLFAPTSIKARRSPDDRPNIVLLFMDDLGYGDLSFTGHPTMHSPNIDALAWNGKILTTWYSGCSVCSGSRAALMTGRQYTRIGVPGVLNPTTNVGLPLNETTVAEQLKKAGYVTAAVGKWHLGQRQMYLPANQGFDYYLGIPYSDDMGNGWTSACPAGNGDFQQQEGSSDATTSSGSGWLKEQYKKLGLLQHDGHDDNDDDPASIHLPLVYQEFNHTTRVIEQPLDFTKLAKKYNAFCRNFISTHKDQPFFLYVPFSHVHTTSYTQPEKQYAGCQFKNSTGRGAFGDALAESDWIVGNIVEKLRETGIEENTLILFASDNGPWLFQGTSGGSAGLLTGRYAGYWNTGKGTTWEGGIRMPAFAYWKGKIKPFSRSSQVVSSLDIFPTLSKLAGVPLPSDLIIDGKDMSDILLSRDEQAVESKHDFLFFYGTCHPQSAIAAVRHGKYKAHWCTGPGLGGNSSQVRIYDKYPLLFDVEKDPAESIPISTGDMPSDPEHKAAMLRIMKAFAFEKATFNFGKLVPETDRPGEGPGRYGVCCDRAKACNCTTAESSSFDAHVGILNIGTKPHHDRYHDALGEKEPNPPTLAQTMY